MQTQELANITAIEGNFEVMNDTPIQRKRHRSAVGAVLRMFLFMFVLGLVATLGLPEASAQVTLTVPDASASLDTVTTAVNSVLAIVAGAVGFFAVVRVIKWIRK